jgi:TorA maturation chaperone TorD
MTTAQDERTMAEWMDAIARGAIYALLSHAISYPMAGRIEALRTEVRPLLSGVVLDDDGLALALGDVLDSLDTPLGELQHAFDMQFSHITSPDCPAHETAFSIRDVFQQAQVMADIAGFFGAHGVQVGASERERPDHIGAELEFMSLLARKEAHAVRAGLAEPRDECRRTEAMFLRDHLGCWGPSFGRRVEQLAATPLYRSVGGLLTRWLEADMAALEVQPAFELDEPVGMPPQESDEEPCGLGGVACGAVEDQLIAIETIK